MSTTIGLATKPPDVRSGSLASFRLPVFLLLVTWFLVGCGAGQNTQTSDQVAAINGTHGEIGDLRLRNVYLHGELVEPQTGTYGKVRLAFTIVNTNTISADRLVAIDSPHATFVIEVSTEELEMAPGTRLAAGQAVEQLDTPSAPDEPITVLVTLNDSRVTPGLTVPVDFTFEQAGKVRLDVPFDVWTPGEMQDTHRPLPPPVTP